MLRTVAAEDVPRFNVSDVFSIVPVDPVPYSGFQVFGIFAFLPFVSYCSLSAACGYTAGVCLEVSDWDDWLTCTAMVLEIDLADHLLGLLDLKVNLRLRNALLAISLPGVVRVAMMSLVRLYSVIRAFYTRPADPHYLLGYTTDTVETNLAIITASAPALWPLRPPLVFGRVEFLGSNRPYLYPGIEMGTFTATSSTTLATTQPSEATRAIAEAER